MAAVREAGVAENTLILFSSDNGPWSEESKTRLRGGKFTNFEGGQRVPFLAWWPGTIDAGRVGQELGATIDLHPTLATIAGAELSLRGGVAPDGIDLSPYLLGASERTGRSEFFYWGSSCGERSQGVRDERWKLITKSRGKPGDLQKDELPALFDLVEDPAESANLADQHPEIVERLLARIDALEQEIATGKREPWREEG